MDKYWLKYVDEAETNSLAEEILELLRERLCLVTRSASWPISYRLAKTPPIEMPFLVSCDRSIRTTVHSLDCW